MDALTKLLSAAVGDELQIHASSSTEVAWTTAVKQAAKLADLAWVQRKVEAVRAAAVSGTASRGTHARR